VSLSDQAVHLSPSVSVRLRFFPFVSTLIDLGDRCTIQYYNYNYFYCMFLDLYRTVL